ncbi:MAG: HAMP domain-containing histidine kinase [Myxococcales bacterium]|nr:HAMP domain-containing histidine kinase [Myxococcales bacterium]
MTSTNKKQGKTERDQTDQSLAHERTKTDEELARRSGRYEENANVVVDKARQRADETLQAARGREDVKPSASGASSAEIDTLTSERRREDATLRRERATADENLSSERAARRKALVALLAHERERTDEHLRLERDVFEAALGARDEFLGMASHDLRDLLGGVAVSAAALLTSAGDPAGRDAIEREARRIQRLTARMARLAGDLVDVVSIQAGHLALAPQRHDAVELVSETIEVFQPLATAKGMWIGTDIKPGSLLARYDHDRILQVLANLVGNALKFTPEGGRIHILVEPVEGHVRFSVSDTGPGIAAEQLQAIFERFWQAARKGPRSGLGLGLYISKCIVEAHGGTIWAESRVGEGCTFSFTLPAAERPSVRDLDA